LPWFGPFQFVAIVGRAMVKRFVAELSRKRIVCAGPELSTRVMVSRCAPS